MNKMSIGDRVKAVALNWLGFRFTDVEQWRALFRGSQNTTGICVDTESVMRLSAAYACVRLISQTIASVPCAVYKRDNYISVPVEDDPRNALLSLRPNQDQTPSTFWESLVASILFQGNGYIEMQTINERLISLMFRNAECISPKRTANGRWEFDFNTFNGIIRTIPESKMIHIPNFSVGGKFGISSILYGAEVMGSAIAANTAANTTFKNGLMPTVAFQMEKILNKTQREEFRENMQEISGALRAGRSPLLEGGMEAKMIGINPEDAQLLESRSFSIDEICRWYGVPPSMIGHNDKASSWASSLTNLNQWYRKYTISPLAVKIEQALNYALFTPDERGKLFVRFDLDELERGDIAAQSAFWASGLQNGYLNRNFVRRKINQPPIEGGDAYTVQSSMIDLNQLISQAVASAVASALPPPKETP